MEKTTFNTNDTDKKAPTPQSPLPPEPRDQQAPRPTGTYQPGLHPEPHGEGQRPRPYPNPARPGQATYPAPQTGYRPTAPVDGPAYPGGNGPQYPGGGYPGGRYPGGPRPMTPGRQGGKSGGSLGLIIGIVAVALVIVGVGCWWYFGYRNSHPIFKRKNTCLHCLSMFLSLRYIIPTHPHPHPRRSHSKRHPPTLPPRHRHQLRHPRLLWALEPAPRRHPCSTVP